MPRKVLIMTNNLEANLGSTRLEVNYEYIVIIKGSSSVSMIGKIFDGLLGEIFNPSTFHANLSRFARL